MAGERVGPYIDYFGPIGSDGLYRVSYADRMAGPILFGALRDLDELSESSVITLQGYRFADGIDADIQNAVVGVPRPADQAIRDILFHTDMDFYKANHWRWSPRYPHRVLVTSKITSHGNLSVTLSLLCLSGHGVWDLAPEWRSDPFQYVSGFRERPGNEVLYLRGVEPLFVAGLDVASDPLYAAQCRAVLATYWLVMDRLSTVFELHFETYVAGLAEQPETWGKSGPISRLEIVDGLREYREHLAEELADFPEKTGYSPEDFYRACETGRKGYSFDRVSKNIRYGANGSVDLVPSAIARFFAFLEMVKAYGIWVPKR